MSAIGYFIANFDDFKSLKYPALQLFVLPDRFEQLIQWWKQLKLYVNRNDISIRHITDGEVESFGEIVKQLRGRILEVRRDVEDIKIGRPPIPRQDLKPEYKTLCETLEKFFEKNYPNYVVKRHTSQGTIAFCLKFGDGRSLEEAVKQFQVKHKIGIPYRAIANISNKPSKETNTVSKIARMILATKYNLSPSTIKKLV